MAITHTPHRPRKLAVVALGIGLTGATVLAGCTGGGSGDSDGGQTAPYGASAEEYQAALADMEPVELVIQVQSASEETPGVEDFLGWLDRVTEYSGGKITWDLTYANGIISNVLEFDDALIDGRMDVAQFWPQYDPAEYPASNELLNVSVLREPKIITGWYGGQAAMQEIGLRTPEVLAEWEAKGLIPLNIMSPDGPTVILCREPITSLADLQGKQIRAGGTVHARQIEELGAIPVSLPYPEVYEALQRGILDCSMSAYALASGSGHLEVAPYVMHTDTASFASTPTNYYAGARVGALPQVAQQLIVESAQWYEAHKIDNGINALVEDSTYVATITQIEENGGEWLAFDADVQEKLAEINEGILADVEASSNFDGADLVTRAREAYSTWTTRVNELGYTDDGPPSTFPEWFTSAKDFDEEPWLNAVLTEIFAKYSPV